jgi:hypothetical protein
MSVFEVTYAHNDCVGGYEVQDGPANETFSILSVRVKTEGRAQARFVSGT